MDAVLENAYEVLELVKGAESTDAEIKKAYKLLALKKHPDKQRNNPRAAEDFDRLQKAFELLSDGKAKAALDDLLQAKAARRARQAGQSEKRRKMQEDLARKEEAWQQERGEEQRASSRLKAELDRLRRQMAESQAQQAATLARARAQFSSRANPVPGTAAAPGAGVSAADYMPQAPAVSPSSAKGSNGSPPAMSETLLRTLKVSWDKDAALSSADLRRLFGVHGGVENVILNASRKKRSALVVMSSMDAAIAAAEAVTAASGVPLLVLPLSKVQPSGSQPPATQAHDGVASAGASDSVQPELSSIRTHAPMHDMPAATPPSSPVGNPFSRGLAHNGLGFSRLSASLSAAGGVPAFAAGAASAAPQQGDSQGVFGLRPSSFPGAAAAGCNPFGAAPSSFPGMPGAAKPPEWVSD